MYNGLRVCLGASMFTSKHYANVRRGHSGTTEKYTQAYYSCQLLHVVLHIRMELELVGLVSDCKVALGDSVPSSLKGHLVAGEPALIAHHCCTMDSRTINVVVNITAKVDVLALVACLDLAALLAGKM